ncbi:WD40-like Beta Propeller Repeat [Tenacibaculum sediminilitoris]|uniref:TolB family protein n=1 Tax=Tenacibaculum sediminilitoris TaxID=1820334 RepID=UPI0038942780
MKKIGFLFLFISCFSFSQSPKLFLPELFNGLPNVRDFSMSKNENEFYFTVESYLKEYSFIAYSKKVNNKWQKPEVVSFSGQYKDLEPFLSPDGLKLFFASNRKNNDSGEVKKDMDIWYVTRKSLSDNWSNPINIGSTINTSANEFYPSVTEKGDLFFTAEYENSKGKEDIYVSRLINSVYTKPIPLDSGVNSEKYEFNAFVAPDESFIIFTSYGRKDDLGRGDLYISKKGGNNEWLPASHLSSANSNKLDYCPFVDLQTNTLYFTSNPSSVAKVLPKKMTLKEFNNYLNSNPNGLSRIYKIPFLRK